MVSKFRARAPYFILALVTLVLDRWTKFIIHSNFDLHESISIIDGFFNITYVRNTGVAFGIFASIGSTGKAVVLSIVTGVAAAIVIVYSFKSSAGNRLLQLALAFILGGALGNLYDRVRFGYVIDFLEFYAGNFYWPAFNVADAAISTGVVLLALEVFRSETPSRS